MARSMDGVAALAELLSDEQEWHVWLLEFGLTHAQMRLALHQGTYPRHRTLECIDCVRTEGDVRGGPYSLEIERTSWHGESMVELRAKDGSFRLVCGS